MLISKSEERAFTWWTNLKYKGNTNKLFSPREREKRILKIKKIKKEEKLDEVIDEV